MLQSVNDENKNVLHQSCQIGSAKMIEAIIEVANQLSQKLKTRKLTETLIKSKHYKMETPNNPNVFMGLMHVQDQIEYTPFFYLCERGNKTCNACKKQYSYDNKCAICQHKCEEYYKSIEMLID